MHPKLPKEIEPLRLAQQGLGLEGELPLSLMSRLSNSLLSDEGLVKVKLAFEVDEIGMPYMKGEFASDVSIQCERCSSPMRLALKVNCLLGIVSDERKINDLPEQYDPWLLESSDPVLLQNIIEDELILSLPLVPKHNEMCLADDAWAVIDSDIVEEEAKPSPFAVLEKLKTKK